MRIDFLTKNYTASEKLKEIINKKIEKLDKFFEEGTKVKVLMKESNDVQTLELTIMADKTILRAEVSGGTMYENIDIAIPKIEKQIIKHRTKLMSKSKKFKIKEHDESYVLPEEEKKRTVIRNKSYELTPMTVEDAIDELELVGHSFYIFANKSTKNVNVLYKRIDGDYGLIEALY